MSKSSPGRYVHTKCRPTHRLYQQGKEQYSISIERYHYLLASITGEYTVLDAESTLPQLPGIRQTLYFNNYKGVKLKPIRDIRIFSRPDGSVNPEQIAEFQRTLDTDWKTREGGILYCVAEWREYWNCLVNYRSPSKTTGSQDWDKLFEELKANNFDKKLVPCMVRESTVS